MDCSIAGSVVLRSWISSFLGMTVSSEILLLLLVLPAEFAFVFGGHIRLLEVSIRALKQAKEIRINTHTSKKCRNISAPWDYIWLIGV